MKRRRGTLTDEDRNVWAHVARTARPMPGKKAPALPEPISEPRNDRTSEISAAPSAARIMPKVRVLPPLAGLEKRMRRDVTRGNRAIDARLDLHGMRQAEAHQALLAFVHRAHHSGARLVLVITGKGGGLDARGEERGVLRRMVPHWLAEPGLRRIILGYEEAGLPHGGEGALYVRLRRERPRHEA